MHFLLTTVLDSTVRRWLISAGIVFGARILLGLARRGLKGRLGRWLGRIPGTYDDAIVNAVGATRDWFLWTVAVYAGSLALKLPREAAHGLRITAMTLAAVQVGMWAQCFVHEMVNTWTRSEPTDETTGVRPSTAAAALTFIGGLVIWCLIAMLALQNAGIEIGALLAGLGVGGIAAALALQSVLGDLFASLSIYADRPFDLGDFIIVGEFMGTVEKVGLRSTRLAALGGEQIVLPNGEVMKSRIRNYRRMSERRVVNKIGVTYGTSYELLESIPGMLRESVQAVQGVRFDRAHLSSYGDSSLEIEFVYYVLSPDYNAFMDRQQAILLQIFRHFERSGIEFAFPTRTLYVRQGDFPGCRVRSPSNAREQ
jgi:small-conductance mechanosensitive channel